MADGQATTGLNITTDLLTANPNLVGIFADNLIMGEGAGQAIAENKVADKVALISFDSDDKTIGFLEDGTTAGLLVQDPYRMGYDGVKTALAVSKGEKVDANVDTRRQPRDQGQRERSQDRGPDPPQAGLQVIRMDFAPCHLDRGRARACMPFGGGGEP